MLDLRSVRDPGLPPGRSPCPDSLLRVGDDEGLDDGLVGVLMVWLGRCSISDTPAQNFDGFWLRLDFQRNIYSQQESLQRAFCTEP